MLAVMLQMSVKVTVAMLVVVPMIGVIVSYVGKRYRRISRGIQDGMGTMAQTAEQSLAAQQEVKVHGTQQHEMSRYSRLANRMLALNMKVEITRAGASSVVQFLAALALAATGLIALAQWVSWKPWAVRRVPLLWILYAGYLGVGIGLLVGAAHLAGYVVPWWSATR
ncbi:hypothetical protein G6F50_015054 [Rhizopus delemar]|uniref:ABC transmembrane type-1 domain-containing protein n=1 Tax=Rhizopus delemar TaxID=936053 RepID=A0A9P6Y0A3_9FUNG|nr:hypothetical protein G6F50_015054 [Rhizopus delemar]